MISLFLDTSSSYLTLAILKDGKELKSLYEYLDKDMSKETLNKIKIMMDSLNLKPNDVSNIIVVTGPGSYTGLRVGVTIAKTYAWGLHKNLYSVSSLKTLATTIFLENTYIVPIIDARRGYFFAGIYDEEYNEVLKDTYIKYEELKEKLDTLDKPYKFVTTSKVEGIESIIYKPNIENLFKHMKFDEVSPHTLVPNYLKKTEAEENLKK
mgnify:FL=1